MVKFWLLIDVADKHAAPACKLVNLVVVAPSEYPEKFTTSCCQNGTTHGWALAEREYKNTLDLGNASHKNDRI